MSTEIKLGQVWKDATGPAHVRIDEVTPTHVGYTWMDDSTSPGLKGARYVDQFLQDYEPTTPAPSLTTQASDDDGRETAPLDPGAVKAGDTVTVRFIPTGEEVTTKAYRPDDVKAPWVYLLGWPLIKGYDAGEGGTFGLALKYFELLSHQPAPEPEPEWVGKFVSAVVDVDDDGRRFERRQGFVSRGDARGVNKFNFIGHAGNQTQRTWMEDARPLVVLDPATVDVVALMEGAIKSAAGKGYWPDRVVAGHMMRHLLAHLGLDGAR